MFFPWKIIFLLFSVLFLAACASPQKDAGQSGEVRPRLEIHLVHPENNRLSAQLSVHLKNGAGTEKDFPGLPPGTEFIHSPEGEWVLVEKETLLNQESILCAKQWKNDLNIRGILLMLDEPGAAHLEQITTEHKGGRLALFLEGKLVSAPLIFAPIHDGKFCLFPNPSRENDLEELVRRLNLPSEKKPRF